MAVTGLNHAVLFVSDTRRSADFYRGALGMQVVDDLGQAVFLNLPQSGNHHDLGLFSNGGAHSPVAGRAGGPGLYHLAWEVDAFDTLVAISKGEIGAEVISADKLSAVQLKDLKAALKASTGRDVTLSTRVDSSLLGGLIVKVGSRMMDNSLKTKLQNLKIAMKGTA